MDKRYVQERLIAGCFCATDLCPKMVSVDYRSADRSNADTQSTMTPVSPDHTTVKRCTSAYKRVKR